MTETSCPLTGVAASPGRATGRAVHVRSRVIGMRTAPAGVPSEEQERLTMAIRLAAEALAVIRDRTLERVGPASAEIFDVHLSFLRDPGFVGQARALIDGRGVSAAAAITSAAEALIRELEECGDETLAVRATDLRDVADRILSYINGSAEVEDRAFAPGSIVVADDLTPSELAQFDLTTVCGVITAAGSATSHTAILARALGVPAIVGLRNALSAIPAGVPLLLDGVTGEVHLHPSASRMADAREQQASARRSEAELSRFVHAPSTTADGRRLTIAANIGDAADVRLARRQGAEGIGLFRSETAFLHRANLPSEDELYAAYAETLAGMSPLPVVIRTVDIGGDKQVGALEMPREDNPFLGVRGVRFSLAREQLCRMQLRALLRASVHGRLEIMLPMISLLSEFRCVRRWLDEERHGLECAGREVAAQIAVGIMIETPASALQAELFAREVDFFSIGTNDLVQYTMAADRTNSRLAHLHAAHHPAVLRLIQVTIEGAHRHGKRVGLCGELGSDLRILPVLDGLGLDGVSVPPRAITRVRQALSALDHEADVRLAKRCLALESAEQVIAAVSDAGASSG